MRKKILLQNRCVLPSYRVKLWPFTRRQDYKTKRLVFAQGNGLSGQFKCLALEGPAVAWDFFLPHTILPTEASTALCSLFFFCFVFLNRTSRAHQKSSMTALFTEASPQVFQKVTVSLMFHVKFAQLLRVSVLQLLTHFHLRDTADPKLLKRLQL